MKTYLRLALRSLFRRPGYTLVAVTCLGLGLGANIAVFAVVYSVLLRPLPVRDPERLVRVYDTYTSPEAEDDSYDVSPARLVEWQAQRTVLAGVAAARLGFANLAGEGGPTQIRTAAASANFFAVLGASPQLGRGFVPEEDRPGGKAPVMVLSDDLWHRRFAADPSIVGTTVRLDGESRTIVGIMPPGFAFPREGTTRVDAWLPLNLDPGLLPDRNWHTLRAFGRLRPAVPLTQAEEALRAVAARLARLDSAVHEGWGVRLVPVREDLAGKVRPALVAFLTLTGFVLLIAGFNLANLQLAAALSRSGELSVRLALGGTHRELLKQFLAEGLVLGALGAVAGVALTYAGMPRLIALSPAELALQDAVALGLPVLAFGILLSLVVGALVALLLAWRVRNLGANDALQSQGFRASSGRASRRGQRLLVVGELALALTLLVGALLMLKSLLRLEAVDPGFDPHKVLTVGVNLPLTKYPEPEQWVAFTEALLREVREVPGVEACGATLTLPMGLTIKAGFAIEGRPATDDQVLVTNHRLITPGYLEALRVPLLRGRAFDAHDRADAPGTVIVSRELARRYWPGEEPIGKRVKRGGPGSPNPWLTVVGVVGDVRDAGLDAAVEPTWYLPLPQSGTSTFRFVVRTRIPPAVLAPAVREAVWRLDREQAVHDVASLEELLASSLSQQRFNTLLLGVSALLGFALALGGVYGVISYLVTQRCREFGIRMSLGARRLQIVGLVLREGALLTVAGALLGALLATVLGRLLSRLLAGISGHDLPTLAGAAVLLSAVALLASAVPAVRATRLDIAASLDT